MSYAAPDIADRLVIEDMYTRYLWSLDTHQIEPYLECFWEDGALRETQLDGSVEQWNGQAEIRTFTEAHFGGYSGFQHRDGNHMFIADPHGDPDRWQVYAYWFTSRRDPETNEVAVLSTGYSRDIVERRNGEWRFALRWLERWPGEVTYPLLAPPLER